MIVQTVNIGSGTHNTHLHNVDEDTQICSSTFIIVHGIHIVYHEKKYFYEQNSGSPYLLFCLSF